MIQLLCNFSAIAALGYGAGHENDNVLALCILIMLFLLLTGHHFRYVPRNRFRKPSLKKRILEILGK